jgi:integrase
MGLAGSREPRADGWPKVIYVKARTDALEPITLHEARHTCASFGVNAKALSVIMGHSTIAMTFDTYGHLMPGGLDEARAATDAYLASPADGSRLRLAA